MAYSHYPVVYQPTSPPSVEYTEVLHYLGYGNNIPDETTAALVTHCTQQLNSVVQPHIVYACFALNIYENGVTLKNCKLQLPGQDIVTHLQNCHHAVLFCATLSAHADALIRNVQVEDMAAGLIMDSCATAAVEQLCNEAEVIIKRQFPDSYFTTRYSPGYGDLPLSIQKDFLNVLDAPRKIGVCATDNSILTPRKSVTAIIGITDSPTKTNMTGCAHCNLKKSCSFYKKGEFCGLSNATK